MLQILSKSAPPPKLNNHDTFFQQLPKSNSINLIIASGEIYNNRQVFILSVETTT